MTPDELKSIPKGHFVIMKTGTHPMQTRLRLFLEWGIRFGNPYEVPERAQRVVAYASKDELEKAIRDCASKQETEVSPPPVPDNQRSFHETRSRYSYARSKNKGQRQEERSDMRTKGE